MVALRGSQPDRVLTAARALHAVGELMLEDAARICAFLAAGGDLRASRAAARLAARVTLACDLDVEGLDELVQLVACLPDEERFSELVRWCEWADRALSGASPPP